MFRVLGECVQDSFVSFQAIRDSQMDEWHRNWYQDTAARIHVPLCPFTAFAFILCHNVAVSSTITHTQTHSEFRFHCDLWIYCTRYACSVRWCGICNVQNALYNAPKFVSTQMIGIQEHFQLNYFTRRIAIWRVHINRHRYALRRSMMCLCTRTFHFQREARIRISVIELLPDWSIQRFRITTGLDCTLCAFFVCALCVCACLSMARRRIVRAPCAVRYLMIGKLWCTLRRVKYKD